MKTQNKKDLVKLIYLIIVAILILLVGFLFYRCDDCLRHTQKIQDLKDSLAGCKQANQELEMMVVNCDSIINDLCQELDSAKIELENRPYVNFKIIGCSKAEVDTFLKRAKMGDKHFRNPYYICDSILKILNK